MGGSWDRRRQARLALRLPLVVRGGSQSAQFLERTATEHVNIGAIYFRTQAWALMPVGSRVFVAFAPPADPGAPTESSRIERVGRVVRVSALPAQLAGKGERGVALELERSFRVGNWVDIESQDGIVATP